MQVTVFTTPACVQCAQTKKLLDRYGVSYDVVDLSQHPESLEMVKKLGYSEAPVVIAGEKHWSGFRLSKIEDLAKKLHGEQVKPRGY